jgi:hypothetical protein
MKLKIKKYIKYPILLFMLMLGFRIIYSYYGANIDADREYRQDFFGSLENVRKNYASEKMAIKSISSISKPTPNLPIMSAQKFEKTATLKSKSSQFENDERKIKTHTKNFDGVIQYEKNNGNNGHREIHLLIGINPERFDSFYHIVEKIGNIKSKEIIKTDKTNEYRELNAQKASYEKTLASLNELKARGGAIADHVALHDKILEIEGKLQELGVDLGNFNEENEFCSVRFTMYEGATEKTLGFLPRLKTSLEWTIQYFSFLMLGIFVSICGLFVFILIIEKLKIMQGILKKLE